MNKILLYNYSLSICFSGGKKELFKKGTWFLFSSELFCLSVSVAMVLISKMPLKIPSIGLLFILGAIWYASFFFTKNWTLSKIEEIKYYTSKMKKFKLHCLIGLLLYFGSFFLFLLIGVLTFEGYLLR